ncbi:hypothetical protein NDU88_005533 [Pleurodeles waltl]|uniref:Uncharacterized protein n=1 Tax=Pleurodeles waltl TaxID=8319 RepID=A0AAV7TVS9_PLEWA|nr:hypothetical protein NDU88_005533 [Pleurodeles waltl]
MGKCMWGRWSGSNRPGPSWLVDVSEISRLSQDRRKDRTESVVYMSTKNPFRRSLVSLEKSAVMRISKLSILKGACARDADRSWRTCSCLKRHAMIGPGFGGPIFPLWAQTMYSLELQWRFEGYFGQFWEDGAEEGGAVCAFCVLRKAKKADVVPPTSILQVYKFTTV